MRKDNSNVKVAAANAGLTVDGCFNGTVRFREDLLDLPLRRKKPTVWAVWNDLFHGKVTSEQRRKAFQTMYACEHHLFFVLTKRPQRIHHHVPQHPDHADGYWNIEDHMGNVWLGTTVENQSAADKRIPYLETWWPFHTFISVEPLLEPVTLDLSNVDWVIVGGESGLGARRCEEEWIRGVVGQCRAAGKPCWVKQMGTTWANAKIQRLRDLTEDPRYYSDGEVRKNVGNKGQYELSWPVDLRVREWPE